MVRYDPVGANPFPPDDDPEASRQSRENAICTVQKIIDLKLVDEEDCVVRDTIANLMHWCNKTGVDFEHELEMARDFHEMEAEHE